jgi:hypothetical protein
LFRSGHRPAESASGRCCLYGHVRYDLREDLREQEREPDGTYDTREE